MQAAILSIAIFSPTAILLLIFTLMKRRKGFSIFDMLPEPRHGAFRMPPCPPPPPPPRKPRTETINDTTYIFREHWWFRQYPVNDEITLELCVGYGMEWIEGLKPKRIADENSHYPAAVYTRSPQDELLAERANLEYRTDREAVERVREIDKLEALNQICNVPKWRELEMANAQCCCTLNTNQLMWEAKMCQQATESQINNLHQQIIEQQMQARNAELFNRMVAVAPTYYPAQPPTHWSILATEQDYLAWKEIAYGQRVQ